MIVSMVIKLARKQDCEIVRLKTEVVAGFPVEDGDGVEAVFKNGL